MRHSVPFAHAHGARVYSNLLIRKRMEENFSRARNLLLGAVDTVLALANRGPSSHAANSQQAPPPRPGPSSRQLPPCSSSARNTTGMPATDAGSDEHRRLFNYKGKRPVSQKGEAEGIDVEERLHLSKGQRANLEAIIRREKRNSKQ